MSTCADIEGDAPGSVPPPHAHSPSLQAHLSRARADEVAAQFRLLGDPTRLRVISTLLDAGEACVNDLAAAVGLSASATSHQLATMRRARLVRARRHGREVWYSLSDAHVRMLLDATIAHLDDREG